VKKQFLQVTRVHSRQLAISNSITAALQRNKTYIDDIPDSERIRFREGFAKKLQTYAAQYRIGITEDAHLANIKQLSHELSSQFAPILVDRHLRIGTTQKALNLLLKFLWCLEDDWATPIHCPVDSIVLQAAHVREAWTKLDSLDTYALWIAQIRAVALAAGAPTIAEWELNLWNNNGQNT
jgi:hypothetical protein